MGVIRSRKSQRRDLQAFRFVQAVVPPKIRSVRKYARVSVSASKAARSIVILLVEDEFFLRYEIAATLRDAGYEVVEAHSGEAAIALRNCGVAIDVVFTDINLTGPATGWDVADCYRNDQPNIPVLYTSGRKADTARCVLGGVFISKPYQSGEVLVAVSALVR